MSEIHRIIAYIAEGLAPPRYRTGPARAGAADVHRAQGARWNWLDRFGQWVWHQHQRDLEAYLAQSRDLNELEARVRHIERGGPSRYY